MPEQLTFMMGNFEARFPADRAYSRNHMWVTTEGETHRFGLTAYSVRLLQDVYFLDWEFDAPREVRQGEVVGTVESSKAVSSLFAPVNGTVLRFNDELLDDPSTINADSYGAGWLFEMAGDASTAMSPEEYLVSLDAHWEKAQHKLKKLYS